MAAAGSVPQTQHFQCSSHFSVPPQWHFFGKSLYTWYTGILGSGRASHDLPVLSPEYFPQRSVSVLSAQQQAKSPTKKVYLSAGEAVAPIITAFLSAFFTVHLYYIYPRVVKTSLGLSLFENKVCLLSRAEGR